MLRQNQPCLLLDRLIAPQSIKQGIFGCLKAGINPEYPEQGTPQGGVVSPLLANIALNGIEAIHPSVRYADDMVIFLKPGESADTILTKIQAFLGKRGMEISQEKTRVTATTDGFDFLGWHFIVQSNGKFRSTPSEDNFNAFRKKVKDIVNCSNYGAREKSKKLAPIIRGWRNYHKHCKMDGKFRLWSMSYQAWKVFNKEKKLNRQETTRLICSAFPAVSYSENRFVSVKGEKSPFDGDLTYWSNRNSKYYDNHTSRALKKQNHTCAQCGLKMTSEERVHLHHVDGNHSNWKSSNLIAIHESCHVYLHMSSPGKTLTKSGAVCRENGTYGSK